MWMSDLFDVNTVVVFVLVLFRILGAFLAAPLLGNRAVPAILSISFSILASFLVFPSLEVNRPELLSSDLLLMKLVLQEVTIGVLIGFAAAVIFATIQTAGEILGIKVGFAIAQVIDPSNQGSSSVLAGFYVLLGGLIFLALDGHHSILSGLFESFKLIPLGSEYELAGATHFLDLVMKVLVLAIKIAAPVMITATLLNLIFGFITKLSPTMNIYFGVGFILGPVLGLVTLLLTLPLFRILIVQMTGELDSDLVELLRQLKGA